MLYSVPNDNPNKSEERPVKKRKNQPARKKEWPGYMWDEDDKNSLNPHKHAFSVSDKDAKDRTCFYCGLSKSQHLQEVRCGDGERKAVNL